MEIVRRLLEVKREYHWNRYWCFSAQSTVRSIREGHPGADAALAKFDTAKRQSNRSFAVIREVNGLCHLSSATGDVTSFDWRSSASAISPLACLTSAAKANQSLLDSA